MTGIVDDPVTITKNYNIKVMIITHHKDFFGSLEH